MCASAIFLHNLYASSTHFSPRMPPTCSTNWQLRNLSFTPAAWKANCACLGLFVCTPPAGRISMCAVLFSLAPPNQLNHFLDASSACDRTLLPEMTDGCSSPQLDKHWQNALWSHSSPWWNVWSASCHKRAHKDRIHAEASRHNNKPVFNQSKSAMSSLRTRSLVGNPPSFNRECSLELWSTTIKSASNHTTHSTVASNSRQ
mmetsp:Transcript_23790/g.52488  ORF Transcript_23790/g.52488 Transcript_23790/m.52488 type:complete len:202 (+) Transcript_23790:407-1012(+)